jgi:hypothetical protein
MGGTLSGTPNDHNVLIGNPANLGSIQKTVYSSLVSFDFLNIKDRTDDRTTNHVTFVPHQLAFGLPLGVAGVVGISFDKRYETAVRYRDRLRPFGTSLGTVDSLELALARDGGLKAWQVGWGHSVGKWAQLGLSYERVYFLLEEARIRKAYGTFTSASTDSVWVAFRGNAVRAGVMVPLGDLVIGCHGEYFFRGQAAFRRMIYSDAPSPEPAERMSLQFPPMLSAGVSYRFTPQWTTALDLDITLWDKYPAPAALIGAPTDNAVTVSSGAQFIPAPDVLTPKYWEIIQYRAGWRFSRLPVPSMSEWALTLGTGLPLPRGGGLFDIVIEYGQRYDSDYDDLAEEFLRIALGISGGRKWVKSSRDTY